MSEPEANQNSFSRGQRWLSRLNFLIAILSTIAIIVMVNYLAGGYFKRLNIASSSVTKLSPLTSQILDSLTNNISITIFFDVNREQDLYSMTSSLLNEYQNANPRRISVKTLDYTRYDAQARAILTRYNLTGSKDTNFVIFECNGHSKVLYSKSLSDYNVNEMLQGLAPRRSAFRGEMLFTSAIFAVANPRSAKTYFITGHGEHPLTQSSLGNGYSKFSAILADELDSQWQTLALIGTNTIPEDCQLLVIAGPYQYRYHSTELEKIDDYLKKGGRMLILFNSGFTNSGMESILAKWGVEVGNDQIHEQDKQWILDKSGGGINFVASSLSNHRILNAIIAQDPPGCYVQVFCPRPFSITSTNTTPGAPEIKVLASSSEQSVCGNKKGSFPFAITIEQGVIKGSGSASGGTRIVAIGDSYLFCDTVIDQGFANHAFAAMSLNWLLERPEILLDGLVPRPISEYHILLTNSQLTTVQLVFLVGLPGGILLVGVVVWLRRRR